MLYVQDIAGCLADSVGPTGLPAPDLDAMLDRAVPALKRLAERRAQGDLPLLALPQRRDDLADLAPIAQDFRRFADVIVLGTGGSSLGGQTLAALADQGWGPRPGAPKLHFLDNIDPATFDVLFARLEPERTGLVAISKSGGTAETLMQLGVCLDWLPAPAGERAVAITEPRDNALRRIAGRSGMRVLDHDPGVGGRFSVLSNVGLLPALIAGLDAAAVREGAGTVLEATLAAADPRDATPALGAAVSVALAQRGIGTTVMMPYVDRLAHFGLWFRQLWAESLGKNGKGTTPVRALGTVDQHSQLQLYLAGPADKMFTLVMLDVAGKGGRAAADVAEDPSLAYLKGRAMGDLLDAEQRATATSLVRNGRPTRIFRLDSLDERTLGALLMHFMLETILAADLLGVDAFDQPAVEEGKILARQYLGEMGRSGPQ
jgi:glucose-6-phosphate isomerase